MNATRSWPAWLAILVAVAALVIGAAALSASPPQKPAQRAPIDVWMLITGQASIGGLASHHLYDPQMIVVRRGDAVRMRVMNQSLWSHGIEIAGLAVRTKVMAGGDADEISFTADRPGIFAYRCFLPYDPKAGACSPDHNTMIGHLVVLDEPAR